MTQKPLIKILFFCLSLMSGGILISLVTARAVATPSIDLQAKYQKGIPKNIVSTSFLPIILKGFPVPQTDKIVFSTYREENEDIYSINLDGSGEARLTSDTSRDSAPDWSPDGEKIAFKSNRSGEFEIYVMNADGSAQVQLTSLGQCDQPQWSPDGTRIAFYCRLDNNNIIYTMDPDGSDLFQVTDPAMSGYDPYWSPDGLQIAFFSSRMIPGIYVIDADGTDQVLLLEAVTIAYFAWSPDGSRLALSQAVLPSNNFDLFIYDIDSGTTTRVTETERNHNSVDWSPDGNHLIFHANLAVSSDFEIYTITLDGVTIENITNNPADDSEGDWTR